MSSFFLRFAFCGCQMDEDCAPGLGEIDHYRLLDAVALTGLKIPLCCENIAAPLLARPSLPEGVDEQARRTREYLETVIAGLHGTLRNKANS